MTVSNGAASPAVALGAAPISTTLSGPELLQDWPLSQGGRSRKKRQRVLVLYLRPHNDTAAGDRFQHVIFNTLGSTIRVIALADSGSNPVAISEVMVPFLGLIALASFVECVVELLLHPRWLNGDAFSIVVSLGASCLMGIWRQFLGPRRVRLVSPEDLPESSWQGWSQVVRLKARRDEDWQPLIQRIAPHCHAAIIDVSHPGGQGLLWELQTLPEVIAGRVLVIADERSFLEWFEQRPASASSDPALRSAMRLALDGRRILVLRGRGIRARRRFYRAVRDAVLYLSRQGLSI